MNKDHPIFKSVFGMHWENLPKVLRKHYVHRPFSKDIVIAKGKMNIDASGIMNFLFPVFKFLKILAPYKGKNIPVTVFLCSHPNSSALFFDRTFYYPNKTPYHFHSAMLPIKNNVVAETMFLGINWQTKYLYEDNKVILKHYRYAWKIAGLTLPLPLSFIFGKINIEKEALSDDLFHLKMEITHPLLGKYSYSGEFKMIDATNE